MNIDNKDSKTLIKSKSNNYSSISNGANNIEPTLDITTQEIYNVNLILKETKLIIIQVIPTIISFLLGFLNPFITVYSVAHLGKLELASAALSSMFASITGWSFAAGMLTSLDTLCSQSYTGSKNIKQVGVYAQRGFWVTFCLFLPISLFWLNSEWILLNLGQNKVLAKLCGQYLSYLLYAVPPYIGFGCIRKFLQAQGIMTASANIMIIDLPICIIGNYLLVWNPSTSLGFIGAPIACSISNWSSFMLGILYICFIDGKKAWGGFTWKAFTDWWPIVKLGAPGVVMVCSEWWAYEIMAFSASYLGTSSLAAHGALSNMAGLLFQITFGSGTVASNVVGNILGLGTANKAKQNIISCLVMGLINAACTCLLVLILSPYLKSFYSNDNEVVDIVSNTLPFVALCQLGDVFAGVTNGIVRGMGRQDIGAQLNVFIYYFIAIPSGIVLAFKFDLGLKGLWIGFGLGAALIAASGTYLTLMADWELEIIKAKDRLQVDEE